MQGTNVERRANDLRNEEKEEEGTVRRRRPPSSTTQLQCKQPAVMNRLHSRS